MLYASRLPLNEQGTNHDGGQTDFRGRCELRERDEQDATVLIDGGRKKELERTMGETPAREIPKSSLRCNPPIYFRSTASFAFPSLLSSVTRLCRIP
jgi:hypothetical protein